MYNDFTRRQKIIIESNKNFKEKRRVCHSNQLKRNENCDEFALVDLKISQGKVTKIQFCAQGCHLLVASCFLFEKILFGKDVKKSIFLIEKYRKMIDFGKIDPDLLDLNALVMTKSHPNRVSCVKIAADLLEEKLKKYGKSNSN
ncbi:iron-sulfur cluster assembly scaffold protein [Mycoplasma sp. 'Moose RK']|uniref:iron-sulfur cluster assembly scaffold protein n=1 Tax=Mycoplasma sp. 'Moose RK' TaxID=2780095 RepID=UPI0018C21E6F|nr:iron-sulfur cluster assembly scaffold protein [Mycoplasma sp. 'Moose RK']MBG0730931.1 iron-sulfur cluster assembly scaffold protein [Mycoplasma sp. 'Moose RK']